LHLRGNRDCELITNSQRSNLAAHCAGKWRAIRR
jgi:hypothetical protein